MKKNIVLVGLRSVWKYYSSELGEAGYSVTMLTVNEVLDQRILGTLIKNGVAVFAIPLYMDHGPELDSVKTGNGFKTGFVLCEILARHFPEAKFLVPSVLTELTLGKQPDNLRIIPRLVEIKLRDFTSIVDDAFRSVPAS